MMLGTSRLQTVCAARYEPERISRATVHYQVLAAVRPAYRVRQNVTVLVCAAIEEPRSRRQLPKRFGRRLNEAIFQLPNAAARETTPTVWYNVDDMVSSGRRTVPIRELVRNALTGQSVMTRRTKLEP